MSENLTPPSFPPGELHAHVINKLILANAHKVHEKPLSSKIQHLKTQANHLMVEENVILYPSGNLSTLLVD